MKNKRILMTLLLTFLVIGNITNVNASSGRLRKASIKTCNGVTYGQHSSDNHWHVASRNSDGSYSATGNPIYSDPCNSNSGANTSGSGSSGSSNNSSSSISSNNSNGTTTTKTKSNDTTLKYIIIDNDKFENIDNVEYSTTNEKVNIEVVTNDKNAKYEIKNNSNLSIGENNITIEVTAEDGTIKNYNINVIRERILSNDTQIKNITISGKEFDNIDNVEYYTINEKVNIEVVTNDEKATYKIKNNENLSLGDNEIEIEVTAENGEVKTYSINVIRERIPSADTKIDVTIDGEEVLFDDYKATVYVSYTAKTIELDYKLNDEKAKVEIDKLETLKTGDNTVNINVIAEDGTEQKYEIIVHKYTKTEETITTILAFGVIGGMGYGIYYCIKKGKQIMKKIMKK